MYGIENAALDREGVLWAALQDAAPLAGRTLLHVWRPRG